MPCHRVAGSDAHRRCRLATTNAGSSARGSLETCSSATPPAWPRSRCDRGRNARRCGASVDSITSASISALPDRAALQPRRSHRPSGYVGDDTCTACHESEGKSLRATLHGKAQNARTPAAKTNQACETCHGPGPGARRERRQDQDPSVSQRWRPARPRPSASPATIASSHAMWKGSMHDARNLSCVTCHSVHSPKSATAQLKTVVGHRDLRHLSQDRGGQDAAVGTHAACAKARWTAPRAITRMARPTSGMLKVGNWVNETCVSCHAEKRGPFLWDHAPVREACNTCHDPHGSNNDRMLVAKLPMLCQRCHIGTRHPSTIYDGTQLVARSNRLIGRGCVNCHAQIHGSNSPAGNDFLR